MEIDNWIWLLLGISIIALIGGLMEMTHTCFDSDGNNPYQFGYIKGTDWTGTFYMKDKCLSNAVLREYRCFNTGWGSTQYRCEYGCVNGKCLQYSINNPTTTTIMTTTTQPKPTPTTQPTTTTIPEPRRPINALDKLWNDFIDILLKIWYSIFG